MTKSGRVRYDPERLSTLWNYGTTSMPSKVGKEYPVITDANRASLSLEPPNLGVQRCCLKACMCLYMKLCTQLSDDDVMSIESVGWRLN